MFSPEGAGLLTSSVTWQGPKMRLFPHAARIKRLDERLPKPTPVRRLLTIFRHEDADGQVRRTEIWDGSPANGGHPLFKFGPRDPEAVKVMEQAQQTGDVLTVQIIETGPSAGASPAQSSFQDLGKNMEGREAPRIAQEAPPEAPGAKILAPDGELAALTAEKARLEDRIVTLLADRSGNGGNPN